MMYFYRSIILFILYFYHFNVLSSTTNDNIDTIQSIEALSNQIIINTTKIGPMEILKVTIDVYDLESKKLLYSNSFSGILLLISRGKYIINFLEPLHWYGIIYQVFQTTPKGTNHHIEHVMVKTTSGKNISPNHNLYQGTPLILNVESERSKLEEIHGILFSMKWNDTFENRKGIDYAKANITLNCKGTMKTKEIFLSKNELGKNIEIKIENDFGIHEENNGSHKLIAVVKPKHCNKLCWNAKLFSNISKDIFEREVLQKCEVFNPVYAQTEVRDYVSYNVSNGNLIIYTTQPNENNIEDEKKDIINVKAVQLAHLDKNIKEKDLDDEDIKNGTSSKSNEQDEDADKVIEKEFIIKASDKVNVSQFEISDFEEDSFYAVSYTYEKLNPIPYHEEQNFIIKTPDENSTYSDFFPVSLNFSINSNDKNFQNTNKKILNSAVNFYINEKFMNYRILIEVQPLINESTILVPITSSINESVFWLTKQTSMHSFTLPNETIDFICKECKIKYLCDNYKEELRRRRFKRYNDVEVKYNNNGLLNQNNTNNLLSNIKKIEESTFLNNEINSSTMEANLSTIEAFKDKLKNEENNLNNEKNLSNSTASMNNEESSINCSQLKLCYKLHIYFDSKMYAMGTKCENITQLIYSNKGTTFYKISLILFLSTFYHFLYQLLLTN
uniref:EGF-like domain-containing protein n=1 Tax=Parastrongyloides trichosuri TaxID=131310 RepID=A0A0N5A3Q0_PARTI